MKKLKPFSLNLTILDLPIPIITDIISSLPTKTILSCKMVNKLWCSIIKDPKFRMSSKYITMVVRCTKDNRAYKILHLVEPEVSCMKGNGDLCLSVGKEAVIKLNNYNMFDGIPVNNLKIVNCCKGLVCLSSDYWSLDHFFVCNPVMSDYVVVKHLLSLEMGGGYLLKHTGFGFSPKTDEYKVVRIFENLQKKDVDGCCLEVYVCTLGGDDEWRLPENRPPQGFHWLGRAMYFEGALHWIIVHRGTTSSGIVAFDCHEETFFQMDFPDVYSNGGGWKPKELAILRSQLCVCLLTWDSSYREQYDIWVMNEYGVKDSWRKLFVVASGTHIIALLMPIKPLAYWNNGEIVMLSRDGELVSYDEASNTWRAIKITGVIAKVEAMLLDPIFVPTKSLLMQGKQPKTKVTE